MPIVVTIKEVRPNINTEFYNFQTILLDMKIFDTALDGRCLLMIYHE